MMKKFISTLIISWLIIGSAFCGYRYGTFSTLKLATAFSSSDLVSHLDLVVGEKYGRSPYNDTKEGVRVSVERIVKEKYYITYSWITGNQSYFGINLLIEDLDRGILNKEDFQEIWIEDNLGNKYKSLPYYRIVDFPEDQPLGWKQVFFGKFEPMDNKAKLISVYFQYNDQLYEIKNINIE